MARNILVTNNTMMKKDDINSSTTLGLRLLRILGIHGGYQCVAQLSLSRAVVFFFLFAATFSRDAIPCVLKVLKLARN